MKNLAPMALAMAGLALAGCGKSDGEGTNRVRVAAGEFSPATGVVGASSSRLNISVAADCPVEMAKEPEYGGEQQWYGHMDLGNKENRRFFFVLDLVDGESFALYFDCNNNRDLTDDGPPLVNEGSGSGGPGGFACKVLVPWQSLIEDSPFDGDFEIWFFGNKAGWKKGHRLSHYSRTQLKGSVEVGGEAFSAVLADRGYNDADLTNDGIILDLNRNGGFDRDERSSTTQVIDGTAYGFEVSW